MSDSIPIPYLRIWSHKNQLDVVLQHKSSDQYVVKKDGVFLSMHNGRLAAVNPRQVFPVVHRFPSVFVDDLELQGQTHTKEFYLSAVNRADNVAPRMLTFAEIRQEVESYLSLLTHLDPVQFYLAVRAYESGLVGLPHVTRIAGLITPQLTLGTLLLQQNLCTWEELLSVCLDMRCPPRGEVSGIDPSGFELCGEILVAMGRITRTQLEEALRTKSAGDRQIGEILVEMGVCSKQDIENCLSTQNQMESQNFSNIGLLGELLLEGGFVRREDINEALRLQKIARQSLDGILVSMGALTDRDVQQFRWDHPEALLASGELNEEMLGRYVVDRRLVPANKLEEALRVQKHGRQLLGELLVNLKRCSQEDVQKALEMQRVRRSEKPKPVGKLGELLVTRQIANPNEIERAASMQKEGRLPLGSTLVNLGACTRKDFDEALALQFGWRKSKESLGDKLGEELIKEGVITHQRLSNALLTHNRAGRPLGHILIEQGVCTPESVIESLIRRDERRRASFVALVKQHAPRAAAAPATSEPAPKTNFVQKIGSWFGKRDDKK